METGRMVALPAADTKPLLVRRFPYYQRFSPALFDPPENIARVEKALGS